MRASSAYSLFDTESVWAILMRIAPPVMLAQLIQAMYNIVDSYFVGQFSSDGLTALSIVYPVQLIVTAIAVGTGVGVNTLMSRYDGQGNHHLADRTAGTGTVLALISWLIFAVLSGLLMRPFAAISTESSSVADLAVTYGTIVCVGSPGVFLESTWSKVHQARGNMRLPMLAQIAGAAANIVLDPILIFGLGPVPAMGIAGAALATGIGQAATLVIYLVVYSTTESPVHLRRKALRPDLSLEGRLYAIGVPAILNLALPSLLVTFLNGLLAAFSESYVVVLGIYYKLQTFLYLPANGIVQGMRPLIGYNYGAKEHARVAKLYQLTLGMSAVIMAAGTVICMAASAPLIGLFSSNPETIAIGQTALRIICLGFVVSAVSTTSSGALEGLGKGAASLVISLCRYTLIIIPLAFPKSSCPAYLAFRAPITLPMSFMEAAPVSAITPLMAVSISASLICLGKKRSIMLISLRSLAARSSRLPSTYIFIESLRCLIMLCIIDIKSASLASFRPLPRASTSFSFIPAIIRRTALTVSVSLFSIDSFKAFCNSSLNIVLLLCKYYDCQEDTSLPTKNQRLKFALRSVNFELKCYIEKKLPREEKMKHSLAFALSLMLVSGTALALGYYADPVRTAQAFTQNPLNTNWYERVYRTGDLARYDESGSLYYIGRRDFQIKHMGHRVELGEIEAAAMRCDAVTRACCTFDAERQRLHLFYTGSCEKAALLAALKESLPPFMQPNTAVQLDEMPLNKNGKIDRTALAALTKKGAHK